MKPFLSFHSPSGLVPGKCRVLPWRSLPTPYRVWVSEIMLQQTVWRRVDYFDRFMDALHTIEDLAAADEETLLKLWQGLDTTTACATCAGGPEIVSQYGGVFPENYEDIRTLSRRGIPLRGPSPPSPLASRCPRGRQRAAGHQPHYGRRRRHCGAAVKKRFGAMLREIMPYGRPGTSTRPDGAWRHRMPAQRRAAVRRLSGVRILYGTPCRQNRPAARQVAKKGEKDRRTHRLSHFP